MSLSPPPKVASSPNMHSTATSATTTRSGTVIIGRKESVSVPLVSPSVERDGGRSVSTEPSLSSSIQKSSHQNTPSHVNSSSSRNILSSPLHDDKKKEKISRKEKDGRSGSLKKSEEEEEGATFSSLGDRKKASSRESKSFPTTASSPASKYKKVKDKKRKGEIEKERGEKQKEEELTSDSSSKNTIGSSSVVDERRQEKEDVREFAKSLPVEGGTESPMRSPASSPSESTTDVDEPDPIKEKSEKDRKEILRKRDTLTKKKASPPVDANNSRVIGNDAGGQQQKHSDSIFPAASAIRSRILSFLPSKTIMQASRINEPWYHASARWEVWQPKFIEHHLLSHCDEKFEFDSPKMYEWMLNVDSFPHVEKILGSSDMNEIVAILGYVLGPVNNVFRVQFPFVHLLLHRSATFSMPIMTPSKEGYPSYPIHVLLVGGVVRMFAALQYNENQVPWLLSLYHWASATKITSFHKVFLSPVMVVLNAQRELQDLYREKLQRKVDRKVKKMMKEGKYNGGGSKNSSKNSPLLFQEEKQSASQSEDSGNSSDSDDVTEEEDFLSEDNEKGASKYSLSQQPYTLSQLLSKEQRQRIQQDLSSIFLRPDQVDEILSITSKFSRHFLRRKFATSLSFEEVAPVSWLVSRRQHQKMHQDECSSSSSGFLFPSEIYHGGEIIDDNDDEDSSSTFLHSAGHQRTKNAAMTSTNTPSSSQKTTPKKQQPSTTTMTTPSRTPQQHSGTSSALSTPMDATDEVLLEILKKKNKSAVHRQKHIDAMQRLLGDNAPSSLLSALHEEADEEKKRKKDDLGRKKKKWGDGVEQEDAAARIQKENLNVFTSPSLFNLHEEEEESPSSPFHHLHRHLSYPFIPPFLHSHPYFSHLNLPPACAVHASASASSHKSSTTSTPTPSLHSSPTKNNKSNNPSSNEEKRTITLLDDQDPRLIFSIYVHFIGIFPERVYEVLDVVFCDWEESGLVELEAASRRVELLMKIQMQFDASMVTHPDHNR